MSDSDPEGLFTYVAAELGKLNLAYLHLIVPLNPYDRETFFGGTDVGYIDYQFDEERAAA